MVYANAPPAYLDRLGIQRAVSTLFYVEDSAAKAFLKLILERFDPGISNTFEISIQNGNGGVATAVQYFPAELRSLSAVAVFDGDIRGKALDAIAHRSLFLPGDVPVERLFKELATKRAADLSSALGVDDIGAVLFSLEGKDIHDWFEEMANAFGRSKDQIFAVLFDLWMSDEAGQQAAQALYTEVITLMGRLSGTFVAQAETPVAQ